jgi:PAS domain S-box-containing protein
MTGDYAYNPHIWLSLLTVALLVVLAFFSWRRRAEPGALPFMIGCLFAALWAAGSAMEVAAVDSAGKIAWIKFQAVWQLPAVTATTCFVLEYAWPGRWLSGRSLVLLSIPPLLVLGMVLTNDRYHLAWRSFTVSGLITPSHGPGFGILLAYSFGLGLVESIVLVWLLLRSPQHRWPVALMFIGQLGGRMIYVLDVVNVVRSELPLAVVAIAFVFLAYAVALFAFRIFDPIPMARRTAIEQLHAGMLVLDPQGRVASLNPAGERILGVPEKQAKGRPAKEFLPAYPEGQSAETGGSEIEIDHQAGQELRHYSLSISPLRDWRGLEAGRLLLLRDVTEQKQAQEQIVEQQRELATLGERERMARDLHDNLGQVLGYAGIQVDAAAKLSRDGQGSAAAAQLDRLGTVIRDAHADVRQHILDLRSAPSLQQPFFTVVKQYLGGFTSNYDIHTDLTVGQELDEAPFAPDAQLQIFRILQEALSNVRKHSRAHHVQVIFSGEGKQVYMIIQDDGCGFQPEDGAMAGSMHFGLQSMQERAGQMGGSLQVQSTPGAGTRVVLEVPRKER